MYPLLVFSLLTWGIVFERLRTYRWLNLNLLTFQNKVVETLLRSEKSQVMDLCRDYDPLPTGILLRTALERLQSKDHRRQKNWVSAVERKRQAINRDVKKNLWILGTIATASPFVGLFGTVVGILRSFHEISKTGQGGFAVVAGGISEALIATAAGIIVAVIASLFFNTLQTMANSIVFKVKSFTDELLELVEGETFHESQ